MEVSHQDQEKNIQVNFFSGQNRSTYIQNVRRISKLIYRTQFRFCRQYYILSNYTENKKVNISLHTSYISPINYKKYIKKIYDVMLMCVCINVCVFVNVCMYPWFEKLNESKRRNVFIAYGSFKLNSIKLNRMLLNIFIS